MIAGRFHLYENRIEHGVTLGGTSLNKGKRHPAIGGDSRVGANAVAVKSASENSVMVGVPRQVVRRSQPHCPTDAPDLNRASLPDVFGVTLKELLQRVDNLEARVAGHDDTPRIHASTSATWEGVEFSI